MAPRIFTDEQEKEIARLYTKEKLSSRSIAKMYGIKFHTTIRYALERQDVQFRKPQDANRLYPLNPHVFDVIDNEHTAYWLGFLYADGHVNFRTLSVALKASDKKHLNKLKSFLESDAPIKTPIRKVNGKSYNTVSIDITDRHLAKRLTNLGLVTKRTQFQKMVSAIPIHLYQHWLRGLFDGDGSARKSRSLVFCGKYDLMKFVRDTLADQAGSNPDLSISKHKTANLYYVYYSGINVALQVSNYLYKDATVWLERKRIVVDNWDPPKSANKNRDELGRYTSA